jgi:serine/threonine protein kinase
VSYGIVTKAKHKNENEICAIKIIGFNSEDNESLLREIKIVKLKSLWTEDNYFLNTGYEKFEKLVPKNPSIFHSANSYLLHIQIELCYKTLKEIVEQINKELNQKKNETMTRIGYYILSELLFEILESA